jgi:AcrR family transcriptional regulator
MAATVSEPTTRTATGDLAPQGGDAASDLAYARASAAHARVAEIQRARILAALVDVSAERGAASVTVAHVVARAGVSRRTFYELFEDREACFLAAFDDAVARGSRCVLDAYDPSATWPARMRAAVVALLAFLDSDPQAARLLIVDSLGAGARVLERHRRALASIVAAVDEGRSQAKGAADPPPLTAEGVVGGILSVLHSRLLVPRNGGLAPRDEDLESEGGPLIELSSQLVGMIVLPYMGVAAARREYAQPIPKIEPHARREDGNPLGRLDMRLTYRTVRALMAVAAIPGASNRMVAQAAEVHDQGQMSKLLARLESLGLIRNTGGPPGRGEPNAWTLTERGWQVQSALGEPVAAGAQHLPAL